MKRLIFIALLIACLCSGYPAYAQDSVDIRITRVSTVGEDGNKVVTPRRDQNRVRIRVDFEVVGGTAGPFDISATLNNSEVTQHFDSYEPGRHTRIYNFSIPVEDNPEAKIVIDPQGTSGDNNRSNNTFTGRMTLLPVPALPAFERTSPIDYELVERVSLNYSPQDAGKSVTIGMERIRNTATVQALESGKNDSADENQDFVERTATIDKNGKVVFERRTKVRLWNCRVNPGKLDKITWGDLTSDPTSAKFLKMGGHLDGNYDEVKKFVSDALGPDYRNRLTPFDAAKAIFRAIKGKFRFQVTDCYMPSKIIQSGVGQCASGSRLMCASLRSIGIPARTVGGFYEPQSRGGHEGHRICEFYLPTVGWIPCDATPDEKPRPGGHLNGFANMSETNRLWLTWADDAIYDCGYAFGSQTLKGPKLLERNVEMSLRKLDGVASEQ